ncbi:hypothetical protein OE88DRAFT_204205 [Heliocybe sulcata]|uniref:Uncharacterized protein n=1 Tax=Heliocybe sulcata TaxID=5364 RepID=A0A5C3N137_9AGAM|nr:hypothetical protein OE88DRAFT_204205 [Heliocybe sulcata]
MAMRVPDVRVFKRCKIWISGNANRLALPHRQSLWVTWWRDLPSSPLGSWEESNIVERRRSRIPVDGQSTVGCGRAQPRKGALALFTTGIGFFEAASQLLGFFNIAALAALNP